VVYTEAEHAVCVEPQTGPPDALNLRPTTIVPEGVLTAHTTWRWEIEP
jgi:aldose 1-epimerase